MDDGSDTPDPGDRTMQRLEMVAAMDEVFPQRRSYAPLPVGTSRNR